MTAPDHVPDWLLQRLRPGCGLDDAGPRTSSALPADRSGAPYDRLAGLYDVVVGGRLYNRAIWGISRDRYAEVVAGALQAARSGVLLDAGAGSALFTAPVYARHPVRAVLLDLSLGMLRRAEPRLPPGDLHLVQGDLTALPFADASFDAVLHFGIPHVLPDEALSACFGELGRVLRPGATLHVASLVRAGRPVGDTFLRLLQAAGEVAPPRTADELARRLAPLGSVALRTEGSWAFAVVTRGA